MHKKVYRMLGYITVGVWSWYQLILLLQRAVKHVRHDILLQLFEVWLHALINPWVILKSSERRSLFWLDDVVGQILYLTCDLSVAEIWGCKLIFCLHSLIFSIQGLSKISLSIDILTIELLVSRSQLWRTCTMVELATAAVLAGEAGTYYQKKFFPHFVCITSSTVNHLL